MGRAGWLLAFYLVYGALYLGWLFHRSTAPFVGPYSAIYLAFLIVMAVPFFLPPILIRGARALGRRRALFALATVAIGPGMAYALASQIYYHTREHPFDPFLQMHPKPIAARNDGMPRTVRILALGGSTTACGQLAAPDRYPAQLEAQLRASGADVSVHNAGVDWWTTKHSLIHYATAARDWQPDVVVVMHSINDMYRSFETPGFTLGPYDDNWSHFYGPSINGALPPTFESTVFELPIASWFSRLRIRPAPMPLEQFRSIALFERHLSAIADLARADGAEIVLATQPSLYEPDMSEAEVAVLWMDKADFVVRDGYFSQRYADPRSLHDAMAAFSDVVARVASRKSAVLADVASVVPRDLEHFTDDVHYSPLGARVVAGVVADAIRSAGLVDPQRRLIVDPPSGANRPASTGSSFRP